MKLLIGLMMFSLSIQAHADEKNQLVVPTTLNCKQVTQVYGRYAADRVKSVKSIKVKGSDAMFVNKGSLDNEVILTLNIDGEQVTDLILVSEDIAALNSGKMKEIRGLYRESASHSDTWVDALTVVRCTK